MILTREQILAKCQVRTTERDVPEFGGTIRVRELTLDEIGQVASRVEKLPEDQRIIQRVFHCVSLGVVDESGKPMFTPDEIAGFHNAFELVVIGIYKAVVGSVEEVEKNSAAAPLAS